MHEQDDNRWVREKSGPFVRPRGVAMTSRISQIGTRRFPHGPADSVCDLSIQTMHPQCRKGWTNHNL
jgi:hypothetical protein